jgi:hypothetical protein
MNMCVVETRKKQLALRVNNLCLRAMPCIHVGRRAHGHNAIAQNDKSFRLGMSGVNGPDLCVGNNQIGSGLVLRHSSQRRNPHDEEKKAAAKAQFHLALSLSPLQLGAQHIEKRAFRQLE